MAKAKRARKTAYAPDENASALDKLNKAKAKDVDYSKEFKQVGFLGHLGSIQKSRKPQLSVVPQRGTDEGDFLPVLSLGLAVLTVAAITGLIYVFGIAGGDFNFLP